MSESLSRSTSRLLRRCGICGIAGSALLLAADWLMLGSFTSARDFNATWLQILANMPFWRVALGGAAGPIGACLYAVGFWQVFLALRPAGRTASLWCYAGWASAFVCIAGAFHASFPFAAYMAATENLTAADPTASEKYATTFLYFGLLYLLAIPPAGIASLIQPYLIVRGPSLYPRWFALVNPSLLWLLTLLFRFLPAPIGGLLVIGSGNLVFLVFFAASTLVLWNTDESASE